MKRLVLVIALAAGPARAAFATGPGLFPNQALQCGASVDSAGFVTMSDGQDLRPSSAFTLEAWVRAERNQALSPYPIVISKPAGVMTNGDCSYGFIIDRGSGNVHFRVTTTAGQFNATWAGNLLDGYWHHLAGIRKTGSGAQIVLMIDGLQLATSSITGATLYSSEALCIGAVTFGGYRGNSFVGQVDEVRLWNLARSETDVLADGDDVLNLQPGLAVSLHLDRFYPDNAGGWLLRDSARGAAAFPRNGATLTLADTPVRRGTGLAERGILCQSSGTVTLAYSGAVRVSGGRDVVHRRVTGASGGGFSELDVVGVLPQTGIQSTLALPANGTVVGMAGRDSVVFCVKAVPQNFGDPITRLFAVRVDGLSPPAVIGDSLDLKSNVRMRLDPAAPNMVFAAGVAGIGSASYLTLVDVTRAGSPALLIESSLGSLFEVGTILDVARRGAYFYAPFSDGNLRIYRYDSFILNGQPVRTLNAVGSPLALGNNNCRVAVGGTRLYVASTEGLVSVYDITSPANPVLLGTAFLVHGGWEELMAEGDRLALAGANGVVLLNVADPAWIGTVGSYCPDMPAAGSARLTMRDGCLGLTAGLGGYTVLSENAVLGVGTPASRPSAPLVAGPIPSRGVMWFAMPDDLSAEARLDIFDVTGRRVRSWLDPVRQVGGSRLSWNGADERGVALPAGVYLARLVERDRAWQVRLSIVR